MNVDPDDKLISKYDLSKLDKITKKYKYDFIIYLIKRFAVNNSDIGYFKYLDENQLKLEDFYITNKMVKKEIFLKAFEEFKDEIFSKSWNYHEDNIWNFLVRNNSNSTKILKKYIYSYKRNKDSLNAEKGNEMFMKNHFDKIKKFKNLNYINVENLEINLKTDFKKYNKLKNNELKNHIFHILINYMNIFNKKSIIYKTINLALNKLSENKIVIFYNHINNDKNFNSSYLTTFKELIQNHKYIVPIYLNDTYTDIINDINDFIFPNDILIFLNNLILDNKLYHFVRTYKKNQIIAFANTKENIKSFDDFKNLKFFCFKD